MAIDDDDNESWCCGVIIFIIGARKAYLMAGRCFFKPRTIAHLHQCCLFVFDPHWKKDPQCYKQRASAHPPCITTFIWSCVWAFLPPWMISEMKKSARVNIYKSTNTYHIHAISVFIFINIKGFTWAVTKFSNFDRNRENDRDFSQIICALFVSHETSSNKQSASELVSINIVVDIFQVWYTRVFKFFRNKSASATCIGQWCFSIDPNSVYSTEEVLRPCDRFYFNNGGQINYFLPQQRQSELFVCVCLVYCAKILCGALVNILNTQLYLATY